MLSREELNEIKTLKSKKRLTLDDIKKSIFSDIVFPDAITNARQMLWHIENETLIIPECPICNKSLSWNQDKRMYRSFCSKRCTAIGSVKNSKDTSLKKYGVDHYSKTDEFRKKVIDSSLKKYGVEHYSKTDEFKKKYTKTNIEKYGFPYPAQHPDIIEKIKSTNIEKYGEIAYAKTLEFSENFKIYSLEKYGTTHPLQNEEIRQKIKNTNIKKYGVEYPLQSNNIKNKQVNTLKDNYYDQDVLKLLNNPEWLEKEKETKTLYEIADNLGISASNLGKYYKHYGIYFNKLNSNTSYAEKEIVKFLKTLGIKNIIKNSHNIIYPKEIDIFLPDYNLAIEYNGIYWHSESKGKDKFYHLNKTEECEKLGINLLHINDIEWQNDLKEDIWKSIIVSSLGLSEKINSNDCIFSQVSTKNAEKFFNENHIERFVNGEMIYGLYYKDELIQCVIISENNDSYEIKRIATKRYIEVINGIQKIFSNIPIFNKEITMYANRRFFNRNSYGLEEMTYIGKTPPDCQYYHNNVFLDMYDFEYTKNADMNKYDRIWDCGNLIFTIRF